MFFKILTTYKESFSADMVIAIIIIWGIAAFLLYSVAQKRMKAGIYYLLINLIFSASGFTIHIVMIPAIYYREMPALLIGVFLPLTLTLITPVLLLLELKNITKISELFRCSNRKSRKLSCSDSFLEFYLDEDYQQD